MTKIPVDHQPEFIRPMEVKKVFGVSRTTLYKWKNEGLIKIYKRGHMSFVSTNEMRQLIEEGAS